MISYGPQTGVPAKPVSAGECQELIARLARLAAVGGSVDPVGDVGSIGVGDHRGGDAEMLAVIGALEALKGAACAAQARLAVAVDRVRRADEAARGVPVKERGRGVGAEVALARRESPHRGSRLLGLAKALVREMPITMDLLTRGELNEWRATLMVRETATLELEDRVALDAELAPGLPTLSDREIIARARTIAYRLDPTSPLRRGKHAESERYVSLRPAPDTMTFLTAYLPVVDGVSCQVALRRHAEALKASGDPRALAQIMADTLTERLTGRAAAVGPDIEIGLIMTDLALFGDGVPSAPDARCDRRDDRRDRPEPRATRADEPMDRRREPATEPGEPATEPGEPATRRQESTVRPQEPPVRWGEPTRQPDEATCRERRMAAGRDAAREALDVRESEERLDEPAMIVGYGPVPAPFARSLLRRWLDPNAVAGGTAGTDARSGSETTDASDSSSGVASASPSAVAADVERDVERDVEGARVWLRRLYADPGTGVLTDVDTKRRLFTAAQRRHLVFRDQFCRTPWCGAPIRHADHVYPWSRGGPTSIDNAQGLCALCNLVKETQGWSSRVEAKAEANRASAPRGDRGDRGDSRAAGVVTITTPSGATYRSRPPRLTRPVPASLDPVAVGA